MKIPSCTRRIVIETVCYLYVLLFVYAAMSKIIDFENFQAQIGQSPLLGTYAGSISYGVLILELTLAILLCFPWSRLAGLYGSFALMVLFTVYIIIILNFSTDIPCSCGGILEKMGWKEHLLFNCFFILIAIPAILYYPVPTATAIYNKLEMRRRLALMSGFSIMGTIIMAVLYTSSERRLHHDNPFIRKYVTGYVERAGEMQLHNTSLYFAGTDNTSLYLGDSRAPLHIFEIDTMLKKSKHHLIHLEKETFPFTRIQVEVRGENFYVFDGSVPVIFKGSISDWKAKLLMRPNEVHFTNAKAGAGNEIFFKQYQPQNRRTVIGRLNLSGNTVSYSNDLLQKQIDGLFDVDGTMLYSQQGKKFIYLYYYRNQFTVTDEKLGLLYRGNTIDTNTVAGIKVSYDRHSGKRQLSSPGGVVNKIAAAHGDFLLVNSSARGKFEADRMWEIASIIDVYDINAKEYVLSFYIYNGQNAKLRDMLPLNSNLFVLVGHQLQRYEIKKRFNENRKEDRKPVEKSRSHL